MTTASEKVTVAPTTSATNRSVLDPLSEFDLSFNWIALYTTNGITIRVDAL